VTAYGASALVNPRGAADALSIRSLDDAQRVNLFSVDHTISIDALDDAT
jgi:hypothetical protein